MSKPMTADESNETLYEQFYKELLHMENLYCGTNHLERAVYMFEGTYGFCERYRPTVPEDIHYGCKKNGYQLDMFRKGTETGCTWTLKVPLDGGKSKVYTVKYKNVFEKNEYTCTVKVVRA